jgi:hypothetical protein
MRSTCHELSGDQSYRLLAAVHRLRAFLSKSALALVLLLCPSPAGAQTRDPQEAALDDFVAARMLATKCPSWQVDVAGAQRQFSELGLVPSDWQTGGRHARFFDDRLSYYAGLLSRMSETRACEAAQRAFGPSGRVREGWMKRQ